MHSRFLIPAFETSRANKTTKMVFERMKLKERLKMIAARIVREITVSYGPLRLRGPFEDRGFLRALSKGEREPFMARTLLAQVGPKTIFLDVGGHLGQYSLLVANKLGQLRSGHVFVFEPHPRSQQYLRKNISLNNLDHLVTLENCCVSDRDGPLTLYSDSLQSDFTSTIPDADGSSQRAAVTVPAVSIDGYFSQRQAPSLIKIDVEGAELSVLQGMEQMLKQHRPTLFIESNGPALRKAGQSADALISALKKHYTKICIVDEESQALHPVGVNANLEDQCINLYCAP